MFGFYASDYYRGKIEEILLKNLDRKFHMPKYRKSVVRVFTDLLHSIQETVNIITIVIYTLNENTVTSNCFSNSRNKTVLE